MKEKNVEKKKKGTSRLGLKLVTIVSLVVAAVSASLTSFAMSKSLRSSKVI